MKLNRTHLAIALLTLSAGTVSAADLDVKSPWVRGTVAGQNATGAFMELSSPAGTTIVGASSSVAGVTEIHEMKMDGGVMKMRAIPRLDVAAGKPVSLAPGGYHVMLMDLKQQLKKGDIVPLTLQVESKDKKVESVEIKAEVRDLTTAAPATAAHGKH
ncbi:MAG: periplasmic copper chaperone [Pseudomonadota bacterium]|nr:periplasmic copper chaperone [Pseudomonadota bacterium]